ncbi:HAMP domain-containing sensor histidine kinase [Sporichthya sp.]|uniref:sensor histidine kinase n=1 Tax=Sporichthya sp. TaxID=65475 RepID=UPI0017FAB83A|nr:HAMP domain-containing sensor histidine kinase [Sporichthya sp.]MBA3742243.1 HAMP domain-containing histidine kinase [Sporichthya sp.]
MWARLRGLSARTPLRVKLMAALLVLTTAAVGITGATATAVLRNYLVDRLDNRLELYTNTAMPSMSQPVTPAGSPSTSALTLPRLPNPYFLITRDPDGRELRRENAQFEAPGAAPRQVPVTLAQAEARAGGPFDVAALGGDQPGWRALLTPLPDGEGSLMVAVSLNEVDITVSRLARILIAVGLSVLTLVAVLAYAIVRSSLRPLREVEATAAAITKGDLSRRVPEHHRRTEVGQLSAAVNVMLTQIESAVREREGSAAEARASEERMRRFVTDASHELRTPLTSIRGFAELYRQGAATPEQVPSLIRRIEDEATRMGLLVEDLLLLARLDQQRPLERVPVDLVTVATDAVHAARAADPERVIEVGVLGRGDDPPGVIGDESRLRQIADNLVSNACTHTPAGTSVRVGVGAETSDGRHWAVLEVADSGPGLSEEERDRIFERFYRTDDSRARRTGGTGLGLSIVAALVAAHGGDVTVTSSPGQGAVFTVRLPALA